MTQVEGVATALFTLGAYFVADAVLTKFRMWLANRKLDRYEREAQS